MKVIRIKDPRIIINATNLMANSLIMTIHLGEQMYYFRKSVWIGHGRWQIQDDIRLPLINQLSSISIAILQGTQILSKTLGEAKISIQFLEESMKRVKQITLPLKIDGLITGWLFFQPFNLNEEELASKNKFFFIKEISIELLKQLGDETKLTLMHEKSLILHRKIPSKQKNANFQIKVRIPAKSSDVISCKIENFHSKLQANASVLLNTVQRGKDSTIFLIMKSMAKKIGQVKVNYFFQNVFLPNDTSKYCKSLFKQKKSNLNEGSMQKNQHFRIHKLNSSKNSITKATDIISRQTIERSTEPTHKRLIEKSKKNIEGQEKQNNFKNRLTPKKLTKVSHKFEKGYQQLLKIL